MCMWSTQRTCSCKTMLCSVKISEIKINRETSPCSSMLEFLFLVCFLIYKIAQKSHLALYSQKLLKNATTAKPALQNLCILLKLILCNSTFLVVFTTDSMESFVKTEIFSKTIQFLIFLNCFGMLSILQNTPFYTVK